MNAVTEKLVKVSNSLIGRFKPTGKSETYNLVRANKNESIALIQYLTAATVFGTFRVYKKLKNLIDGKKPTVKEYPKDTVILFRFPNAYNIPTLSPFALRLETWCRAAGIKYKLVSTTQRSSQDLIPYIRLNGVQVEDSGIIIDYLTKVFQIDLDAHLSDEDKARARATLKLCELSLTPCMALHRFWFAKKGHKDIHTPLLGFWYFTYRVFRRMWYAGYGRLDADDVYDIGKRDLSALNTLVGAKKFLFSDSKPSSADFMLFGVCAQIKFTDRGPLNLYLSSECKNLNRHVETMKELYWPDWNENTIAFKTTKPKALPTTTSENKK